MTTTAEPPFRASRYTTGAIVLHWAIALLIVGQIALGFAMVDIIERGSALQYNAFQLHKSLGITVLVLTVARIAWRLFNPPPAEPPSVKGLERTASQVAHVLFYVLMLAIPLSGWVLVSVSPTQIETVLFFTSYLPWPNIPVLAALAGEARAAVTEVLENVHAILAFSALGLLVLHVAGAVKHHIEDGHFIARMLPWASGDGPRNSYGHATTTVVTLLFAGVLIGGAAIARHGDAIANVMPGSGVSPDQAEVLGAAAQDEAASESAGAASAPAEIGPPRWAVRPDESALTFTATFSGADAPGRFADFDADIRFDPDDLDASSIAVTIDTGSASIESSDISSARLAGPDGLANETHGTARFTADTIREAEDGEGYVAEGTLALRGSEAPASLPFTVSIEGDVARASGLLTLDRRDYEIGAEADPAGDYLGTDVTVSVDIVADRAATGGAAESARAQPTTPRWGIVAEESTLTFAFPFQGSTVEGRFGQFSGDIRFDPDALDASSLDVTIALPSAQVDGDAVSRSQLTGTDGLAVSESDSARFVADTITATDDGYAAEGTLSLRGESVPLTLPFTVTIDGDRASAEGSVTLDRLDFGIGTENDPEGDYLGTDVTVRLDIAARREAVETAGTR